MNALFVIFPVFILFYFGYRFYSKYVEKILRINPEKKTPAHTKYDGVDYVPAQHWTVLFGHHFASIAGAAPIVGPIIAVSVWGWGPAILWVTLGSIFIGGVHDFSSLLISVKHGGASISDIAKRSVSKNAKTVFLMFVWLTLILIIAVFVHICAKTFVVKPEIVLPSMGIIPIAVVLGYLLYTLKLHRPTITILGLIALGVLMYLGGLLPIDLGGKSLLIWSIVLLIYSFIASVTPVHKLLQPRDYLSSFLLFFGLLFGYAALIFFRHNIALPVISGVGGADTPSMWPFLFVTVACGAVSGFHAIVASGTTSKQISNERDARPIGYGGMLTEGLLAVMTILIIIVVFKDIASLKEVVFKGSGPIGAFGIAYGAVTVNILGRYGELFAMTILNAFILTTLDTATRIGRYVTQELFNIKNRYVATLIVVVLSAWLTLSGKWYEIWPIFGSANQLIAALALIVVTSRLLTRRRKVVYVTLVPTIFMLITAMGALILEIKKYLLESEYLLVGISLVLLVLAVFVSIDAAARARIVIKERMSNA